MKKDNTLIILIACVFFIIIIPMAINEIYKFGNVHGGYQTLWTVGEFLSFYGTVLGSTATILAVIWTINYTKESNKQDRSQSNKINHMNMGIQVIFDFVDSCDPVKMYPILNKIEDLKTYQKIDMESALKDFEIMKKEFIKISDTVRKCHIKFQMLYPSLLPETETYIKDYVKRYRDVTPKIENGEGYEEFIAYYKKRYPEFVEKLRDLIFDYECAE